MFIDGNPPNLALQSSNIPTSTPELPYRTLNTRGKPQARLVPMPRINTQHRSKSDGPERVSDPILASCLKT